MALRALKTEEEAKAVPLDQPILIELPGGTIEDEAEVTEPEVKKTSRVEPTDPDAKRLQEQLEAAQEAQRAADARALKAERDFAERLAKAEKDAADAKARTQALEGDVISGGLAAAQSERDAAKVALQSAGEAGDWKAIAEAQSRIGRAEAKILSLESGAAEIAERKAEPKQEQVRQAPIDPMAAIDANPNLLPSEKAWLKAHPDAVMDTRRNNELSVGYERAIKKGLVRGSADYLAFLEDFMGYAKSDNEGSISVQAPPSRNDRDSGGRVSSNRITLTPEERDIAKSLGVPEVEYAKQKVRFEQARRDDPEKYSSRG